MSDVAKDIIAMEFHNDKTIKKLILEFYKICEKHNIKAHTKSEHGKIGHNFDYTMAKTLFIQQLSSSFIFMEMDLKIKKYPSVPLPKKVYV